MKFITGLSFLAGLLLPASVAFASDLPELGDPSLAGLSTKELAHISQDFKRQIDESGLLLMDPLVSAYMKHLGGRLSGHVSAHSYNFRFLTLGDHVINAFAGPGGIIGINSGLFIATRSESELAAVLAHEIAHLSQHHILRMIEHAKSMRLPMIAGALAAIALSTQSPELGQSAIATGMASAKQDMLNYTRAHESEADNIGIDILEKSGFDPRSMAQFFSALQKNERFYSGNTPEILRTHPVSETRIAQALDRAAQFKQKKNYRNSHYYELMRERLRVITSNNLSETLQFYEGKLKKTPNNAAYQYGHAFALYSSQHFKKAFNEINLLLKKNKDQEVYHMLKAEILNAQNKNKQALKVLRDILVLYPDDTPLVLLYSQILTELGKPSDAVNLLHKQLLNHPGEKDLFEQLAKSQAKAGMTAEAYLSQAEVFLIEDSPKAAALQLNHALSVKGINKMTKAKVEARLKEIEL